MTRWRPLIIAVVIAVVVLAPDVALARAGGGGGGGGGLNVFSRVLWPLLLLYSGVVTALVAYKRREAAELLRKLERFDPLWSEEHIRQRVEKTYFKVQDAWTMRDQELAREYMSERLYERHKAQTDAMLANHRRNVLENVNLIHAKIIGVRDFTEDAKDRFDVHIKGSMVDYHIDDATGAVVAGRSGSCEKFTEIWHFVRGRSGWVLDEIVQDPGLLTVMDSDCASDVVEMD